MECRGVGLPWFLSLAEALALADGQKSTQETNMCRAESCYCFSAINLGITILWLYVTPKHVPS